LCDAILTPAPGEMTFAVMQRLCGPGIVVTEDQVRSAMRHAFERLKVVAEPGGAVALAAALFHGDADSQAGKARLGSNRPGDRGPRMRRPRDLALSCPDRLDRAAQPAEDRCFRISPSPPGRNRGRRAWRFSGRNWRAPVLTGFLCRGPMPIRANTSPPATHRLAWLTGFHRVGRVRAPSWRTGPACSSTGAIGCRRARRWITDHFDPVDWPETGMGDWLAWNSLRRAPSSAIDPWLHSDDEIARLRRRTVAAGSCVARGGGQPGRRHLGRSTVRGRPRPALAYPAALAGRTSRPKSARCALAVLRESGARRRHFLTLPDSVCWLLNIRGADIPRIPIVQCLRDPACRRKRGPVRRIRTAWPPRRA
jgi:hypothetical protein